jgi:hypothetical protein
MNCRARRAAKAGEVAIPRRWLKRSGGKKFGGPAGGNAVEFVFRGAS